MRKILLVVAILTAQSTFAKNVLWDGSPIDLQATVGQEARIDFPENIVELDVSKNLEYGSDLLLTPEGKLFWTPKKDFNNERLIGVSVTGTLYMMNVSSNTNALEDLHYVIIDPVVGANHNTIVGDKNKVAGQGKSTSTYVEPEPYALPEFLKKNNGAPQTKTQANFPEMASFAIAHFTGPKRMIPPMNASKLSTTIIPKRWIRTDANRIFTKMQAAWLINGYYVTAIQARNVSKVPITFDPVAFRGKFKFSATLNPVLNPRGHLGDETIWVFISELPFDKAAGK